VIERGPQPPVAASAPAANVAQSSWPAWPGWLVALVGGVVAFTGLVATALQESGQFDVQNPGVLVAAVFAGSLAATFGLVYECLRSIRARRQLPLERYRGPSPLILLLVSVVAATAVAVPFGDDVMKLIEGGEISSLGSIVLLTSTQAALLLVTLLFVAWPRALAGAPPFDGGRLGRSIVVGIGWGIMAWIVANLIGVLIGLAFEALGIPTEPQAAELAIESLDPFVVVFAVVVFAPLAEEIFFRGVAYAGWRREHGARRATVASAVVFAVIHFSLLSLVPIFLLGLWLAWVYERTRSLLASIVLHATFNGISVALALLVRFDVIRLPT
jgi:membrane protease YdiL (CAAX protease family)